MTGLHTLYLLIVIGMIYGIGCWLYYECRRRRAYEADAIKDRQQIRAVAESAASEAASCAAVIDKLDTPRPRQTGRRLQAVRDERSGVSTWNWE